MKPYLSSIICALLIGRAISPCIGKLTAAELDKYGGTTAIKGEVTGFFHIENINGRNWFITPDGNAFFAVALSHMLSGESDVACQNVYGGNADAWLKGSFAKAREMGFNCALGSATSRSAI